MENNEHTLEFLIELDDILIEKLLNHGNSDEIANLIQDASTNDQRYILEALKEDQAKSVMELLETDEKEEIEEIMAYPEDSAGSMMSTDIFTLHQDTSCGEALKAIQDQEEAEMVFYLYITNDENSLQNCLFTYSSNHSTKHNFERHNDKKTSP